MKIEINISKRHLVILSFLGAVMFLIAGGLFVLAQGVEPNPGHGFDELEIDYSQVQARIDGSCSVGSSIRSISEDGTVVCEVDGGGSTVTAGGENQFGFSGPVNCEVFWGDASCVLFDFVCDSGTRRMVAQDTSSTQFGTTFYLCIE